MNQPIVIIHFSYNTTRNVHSLSAISSTTSTPANPVYGTTDTKSTMNSRCLEHTRPICSMSRRPSAFIGFHGTVSCTAQSNVRVLVRPCISSQVQDSKSEFEDSSAVFWKYIQHPSWCRDRVTLSAWDSLQRAVNVAMCHLIRSHFMTCIIFSVIRMSERFILITCLWFVICRDDFDFYGPPKTSSGTTSYRPIIINIILFVLKVQHINFSRERKKTEVHRKSAIVNR